MIGISAIEEAFARFYNIPQGIQAAAVEPDSGAEAAGIIKGIIIGINGFCYFYG